MKTDNAKNQNFRVIEYYVPIYKKMGDYQELMEDMDIWIEFLLEMLRMKH